MTYDFSTLIGSIKLSTGAHKNAEAGMCAMEFVSWLEGEPFSDHPSCTCPVIAAFVRAVNDHMKQDDRDRLLLYLPRIVGTVAPEFEQERTEYVVWRVIREAVPPALRAIGLHDHAMALMNAETLKASRAAAWAARGAAARAARASRAAAWAARAAYAAASAAARVDAAASAAARVDAAAYAAYAAYAAAWATGVAGIASSTIVSWARGTATDADFMFSCLDGMLAIGPQSQGFTQPVEPTIQKVLELQA